MNTHTLIAACSGSCGADDARAERTCACGPHELRYRLVCPDEGGSTVLVDCGTWARCGCRATTYGPRTAEGRLSGIWACGGQVLYGEAEFADCWAEEIQPACPRSGLPHHSDGGLLYVPSAECFGRECAENQDGDTFATLAIDAPGEYLITWIMLDGLADWKLIGA